MFTEEWDCLFAQPKVAFLIWPAMHGRPWVKPVWLERDGDEIVFVAWSKDWILEAIGRDPAVFLTVESERRIGQFCGRASITHNPHEVAHWGERIWRRYRGDEPRVYSPARSDRLVRVGDCQCLRYLTPDPIEQLYIGYAEDSPEILLAKVIHQTNWVLARNDTPPIGLETPIEQTAFVLCGNLHESPHRSVRVAGQDLVAISQSGDFLSQVFEGSPSWVNLRVVFVAGRPRLVHFECQAPERRQPGLSESQIVLGWSEVDKLTIV